jgi:Flp pilus assembly protein TadG
MATSRGRLDDEHGAAMLELALVLPVLLLLLGGIIDFGFAFNTQISLTHAAREGVRVEAIGTGDAQAAALAAFSSTAATNESAQVTSACPGSDSGRVVVRADSPLFFSAFLPMVGNSISLEGQAVMRCGG